MSFQEAHKTWLDGSTAVEPSVFETWQMISIQLADLLVLQRRILDVLGSSDSRSSVELKVASARGAPDPTVKVYAGSPIDGLVDTALDEFGRLKREADARAMQGWAATVEAQTTVRSCGLTHWDKTAQDAGCELRYGHDGPHGFNT